MSSEKNKNVIITRAARLKMVRARAGDITLPKIVGMAFGDGGVDASGEIIPPTDQMTALRNEFFRKVIDLHELVATEEATMHYECTITEEDITVNSLDGKEVSEIGFYDEDGDILCIKSTRRKGIDDDVSQTYELDDIF